MAREVRSPPVEKPKHARREHTAASQLSRHSFADTSRSICAHSTCTLAPLRQDRAGMYTGGLCSQRGQEWSWDHVRLYPADHVRDNKAAGHRLAANRSADRGGVQGTESELRKGWQCEDAVGHLDGAQRSKARGTTREPLFVLRDLRTAKQSIQDQQKQIRGQYNRRHARNRKHQGFPRFVVTSKPLDLHGQRPIKNLTAAVTSTHGR
jgi:hypothetical protein